MANQIGLAVFLTLEHGKFRDFLPGILLHTLKLNHPGQKLLMTQSGLYNESKHLILVLINIQLSRFMALMRGL